MIKTILWDVDGTLLNFLESERYALKKCLAELGIHVNDDAVSRYSAINISYWKRLERGEISRSQVLLGRFADFFAAEGIAPPPDGFEPLNEAYQTALGSVFYPNDNSLWLCNQLGEYAKQYVVTNGSATAQENKLKASGLFYMMNGVFISEDIGFEKPSKDFFDIVFSIIGLEDLSEAVIIGDSLSSDMLGGNNAGIQCWWYNPQGLPNTLGVRIDREIKDLGQVLDILSAQYENLE